MWMQWSTLHTPTGRPNKFRLNCLHVGVHMPIEHSTILGCFKLSFPHLHMATCKIPSTTAAQQRYLKTKQAGCDRPAQHLGYKHREDSLWTSLEIVLTILQLAYANEYKAVFIVICQEMNMTSILVPTISFMSGCREVKWYSINIFT